MSRRYPRRRFLEMGVAASSTSLLGCLPAHVAQPAHVQKLGGKVQHFVVLMILTE